MSARMMHQSRLLTQAPASEHSIRRLSVKAMFSKLPTSDSESMFWNLATQKYLGTGKNILKVEKIFLQWKKYFVFLLFVPCILCEELVVAVVLLQLEVVGLVGEERPACDGVLEPVIITVIIIVMIQASNPS